MTQKLGRNDPCSCGSGLKYKKCHGGARAQPTSSSKSQAGPRLAGWFHGKPIFVRDDVGRPDVSIADLVEACRPFDVWQGLSMIRRASRQIVQDTVDVIRVESPAVVATQAELARLAAALLVGAEPGGATPTDHDFGDLLRRVLRLREPILEGTDATASREDIELHMSRMMYFDAVWQKERRHVLPRSLLLFKLLEEERPSLTPGCLGAFFEQHLGMDVYEWMLLGLTTWIVAANRDGFISAPEIMGAIGLVPILRERITEEKVHTFLQRISISRAEFRRMATQHAAVDQRIPGLSKYAFNPLFKCPIIVLDTPVVWGGLTLTHIDPMEWLTLEAVSSETTSAS